MRWRSALFKTSYRAVGDRNSSNDGTRLESSGSVAIEAAQSEAATEPERRIGRVINEYERQDWSGPGTRVIRVEPSRSGEYGVIPIRPTSPTIKREGASYQREFGTSTAAR